MGVNLFTVAAVSLLVGLDCQICGSLIDELTDEPCFVADVLKIISAICLFGSLQMGLVGLILILVS